MPFHRPKLAVFRVVSFCCRRNIIPYLQISVIFVRKGHFLGLLHVGFVLGHESWVNLGSWWCEREFSNEFLYMLDDPSQPG
jgi:hypothetical protein